MKYEIWGDVCPALTVKLDKGESIYTQQGGMSWMTDQIAINTSIQDKTSFRDYLKRNDETAAQYKALDDDQEITISATRAGKILEFDIKEGHSVIGRKSHLLCIEESVKASTITQSYNKHLPNSSGYNLQIYTGEGKVFMELCGSIKEIELKEGQRIVAESGNLVAWDSTVTVTEQFQRNFKSMLLAGEGTLMSVVEGPGKIWLQTAPISEISKRIIPFIEDVK